MKKPLLLIRSNLKLAQTAWGELPLNRKSELKSLTTKYALSIALGDLQIIEQRWYVTYSGLLRLAERRHCEGIRVQQVYRFCDSAGGRWVFKATVYKSPNSRGFVGYGDADPSNVSPLVHGAEMRVAETRAVNRALRKAYGIGLCSVEELGSFSSPVEPAGAKPNGCAPQKSNGSSNGQPRLRDRLCLLIRQHQLDSNLVKQYAAEFCGTAELRAASRDRVEAFVNHLAKSALEDRDALVAKLNSFSHPQEVHP